MKGLLKTVKLEEEKLEYVKEAMTNLNEFIKYKDN